MVLKALLLGIPVRLGRTTYELDEETGLVGEQWDGDRLVIFQDGPMPLNAFIRKCRELSDEDAVLLAADVALGQGGR